MAITSSDILYKLSTKSGSAGNSLTSTPAASLGKYISTTQITAATLNNLFDDITGDENAASESEYRCFFVHNNHGSLTWQNVVVWLSTEVSGGASAAIAIDGTAASAIGSSSAQAEQVTNEDTAPVSTGGFSSPTSKGSGLSLGSIPAGSCRAVWVRRTTANNAAVDNDGVTIRCEGDTSA